MRFDHLGVRNFRNYVELSLNFPDGVIFLYGENGQGKTNLMEAIHFLLRGGSFRPCTSSSVLPHDEGILAREGLLRGRLTVGGMAHDLRIAFRDGRSRTFWNEKPVAATGPSRMFPVVLFSPESLAAVKEGPEIRRHLLDDAVSMMSPAYAKVLNEFKRALRTRNRVLSDRKSDVISREECNRLLDSLEPIYLPLAAELTVARLATVKALQDDYQRAARTVLQIPNVEISVDYVISSRVANLWERSEVLTAMHQRAQELRASELARGTSLVGPHRHDIHLMFAGKDSRFFCSQGQQRGLILSFKMAQILYHYRAYQVYPFLLLDDVLSELDPVRRTSLVGFLRDIPAQIFLTATDLSFSTEFGARGLNVFRVEKGTVQAQ